MPTSESPLDNHTQFLSLLGVLCGFVCVFHVETRVFSSNSSSPSALSAITAQLLDV